MLDSARLGVCFLVWFSLRVLLLDIACFWLVVCIVCSGLAVCCLGFRWLERGGYCISLVMCLVGFRCLGFVV